MQDENKYLYENLHYIDYCLVTDMPDENSKYFYENLYYLDKCFFYRDSLGLIRHYLKRHNHLFDVKTYNDLMYYVERKYDNEISVKSN